MLPRIDGLTKVIVLGITGRTGRQHSRIMREYGTNIVGGVSPRAGVNEVDGVPVFADSTSAVRATGATACVAMVGAMQLLDAIKDALKEKRNIEVRGFGTFKIRQRKTRMARNPRTGAPVEVSARPVPVFKPSKELRAMVSDIDVSELTDD
mgnify:CR=1 FL=1